MKRVLIISSMLFYTAVYEQETDTLIKKLDSLSIKADSAGNQLNNIDQNAYNDRTKVNVPIYFILLGSNFRQQFNKPFYMDKRGWYNLGKFTVAIAALSLADYPVQRFGQDLRNKIQTVRFVIRYVTNFWRSL